MSNKPDERVPNSYLLAYTAGSTPTTEHRQSMARELLEIRKREFMSNFGHQLLCEIQEAKAYRGSGEGYDEHVFRALADMEMCVQRAIDHAVAVLKGSAQPQESQS